MPHEPLVELHAAVDDVRVGLNELRRDLAVGIIDRRRLLRERVHLHQLAQLDHLHRVVGDPHRRLRGDHRLGLVCRGHVVYPELLGKRRRIFPVGADHSVDLRVVEAAEVHVAVRACVRVIPPHCMEGVHMPLRVTGVQRDVVENLCPHVRGQIRLADVGRSALLLEPHAPGIKLHGPHLVRQHRQLVVFDDLAIERSQLHQVRGRLFVRAGASLLRIAVVQQCISAVRIVQELHRVEACRRPQGDAGRSLVRATCVERQ